MPGLPGHLHRCLCQTVNPPAPALARACSECVTPQLQSDGGGGGGHAAEPPEEAATADTCSQGGCSSGAAGPVPAPGERPGGAEAAAGAGAGQGGLLPCLPGPAPAPATRQETLQQQSGPGQQRSRGG